MAKKFNKDGLPTDVPTNPPGEGAGLFQGISDMGNEDRNAQPPSVSEEPPTKVGVRPHSEGIPPKSPFSRGEPRTVIQGGTWKSLQEHGLHRSKFDQPAGGTWPLPAPDPSVDPMDDPVVGWLVIIEGPGKGAGLKLGLGQNRIGRGDGARVRIDYGDQLISRASHAVVTYDPKGNQFYVQQGSGTNLTYLDGRPVLSPTSLESGTTITMGETTLRFVAFCDEGFSW